MYIFWIQLIPLGMSLRRTTLFLVALCLMIGFIRGVCAQTALYNAANNYLKKRADAFMTITGYSLTPDVTTGS